MSRSIEIDKVTEAGVNFVVMECFVGDNNDPKKGPVTKGERVEYRLPSDATDFQKLVAGANPMALATLWEHYNYGHGLKARAEGRPSGGVTLPVIATKKYGKLDLVSGVADQGGPVSLENRLKMINAAILLAQSKEEEAPRAVRVAREQLLSGKQATDKNGILVAAK